MTTTHFGKVVFFFLGAGPGPADPTLSSVTPAPPTVFEASGVDRERLNARRIDMVSEQG